MKKIIWIICALSLIIFNGCSKPVSSPIQDFKEVFLNTSDENVCLWVPDLEKNDWIREKTQKPFDIEQYYKLKNHTPLSYYKEDSEMFREKIETLLNNLELKETEKFHKYRILMRIACETEEKDYLVIYDDMTAKIIHIDKNLDIHEEYYEVESVSVVDEFIDFVDSLYEKHRTAVRRYD